MKQGNMKSRVDRGWEQLRPVLDTELPEKKKKKRIAWLWFLPFGFLSLAAAIYLSDSTESSSLEKLESQEQNVQLVNATEKINQETEVDINELRVTSKNKLTELKETLVETNTAKSEQNTNDSKSSMIRKNINSNSLIVLHNEQTEKLNTRLLENRLTTKVNQRADKTIVNLNQQTIKLITTSISNKSEQLSALSDLKSIPAKKLVATLDLPDIKENINLLSMSPEPSVLETKRNQLGIHVGLGGFFAHSLQSPGTAIDLGLKKTINKWSYGLTIGAGYHYNDFPTNSSLASIMRNGDFLNPVGNNTPTTQEDLLGNSVGFYGNYYPKNDHKKFVNMSFDLGYQINSKIGLTYQLGAEKYWSDYNISQWPSQFDANSVWTENSKEQQTSSTTINTFVPYNQFSVDCVLSNKFTLRLGYRFGLKEFINYSSRSYRTNKLSLQLAYQI